MKPNFRDGLVGRVAPRAPFAYRRFGARGATRPTLALLALISAACRSAATELDASKLPPADSQQIEFTRDIKPILESRCIRCHGTERPKSKFSLATREAALRGGENGNDIIVGDSAKSPFIHYVARLVPDMEMPPPGKGDPLTDHEIALLRAWIDQGVTWEKTDLSAQYAAHFSFTPAVRWTTTSGNARKFQKHQWVQRGVTGGSADFRLGQKFTNGVTFSVEGRALTDDYKLTLDIRKDELGFARFGFEQFRHYYDDRGPYFRFRPSGFATITPSQFDLNKDVHLDTGKAFAEFGLTLPDWPRIVLGYEYQFRHGTKSTEQWGPVTQSTGGTNLTRHTYPAWKDIDEGVHIVKLDVSHEVGGVYLEDNMRAEFYELKTARVNDTLFNAGARSPSAITLTRETHDQFLFANTLRAERPITDWFFVSAGYLFSQVDADATLRQTTVDGVGRFANGTFWSSDVVLRQSSHVVNANALGGPWSGFSAGVGVQTEFTSQEGFGPGNLRESDPNDPTGGITPEPVYLRSDMDTVGVDETLVLRYTSIPWTVLFAEARLKQEQTARFEEQVDGHHDFLRDTDNDVLWQDYRAGFNVSPLRWLAVNASYRWRLHGSEYHDDRDEQPHGSYGLGYPAFIRSRESETHQFETRVVLRPSPWLKTTLSYQLATTDYETRTDPVNTLIVRTPGGDVLAGEHDSSTYSANLTLTPFARLFLSGTISYQDSRIVTHDNHSTAVAPYEGGVLSIVGSATYAVARNTDVMASYSFSRARYGQNHFNGGVPLGLDYDLHAVQASVKRTINDYIAASLGYGFFDYTEASSRHLNDYSAHMVFGLVSVRLP